MADKFETGMRETGPPVRLNITASDLHERLHRSYKPTPNRNRRLERIAACHFAPRHGCHFAYIYPFPSLFPTY